MFNKIGFKIILSICLTSIITALVVGGVSLYKSKEVVRKESLDKIQYMAISHSERLNKLLKETEGSVKGLELLASSTFDVNNINNPEYLDVFSSQIDSSVKYISENTKGIMASYVYLDAERFNGLYGSWYLDDEGVGQFEKQVDLGSIEDFQDPNNSDMAWYFKPMQEKRGIWSEPYVDTDLNIKMITFSMPLMKNGEPIGVVGMDIKFDLFEKAVSKIKIYDSGYAFLVDSKYQFLVHPTFTMKDNLKTLNNGETKIIASAMEKKPNDIVHYKFNGDEKVLGYSKLENGWYLSVAPVQKEIERNINQITLWIIGIIIGSILLIIPIGSLIARKISGPIKHLSNAMLQVSSGDLTQSISKTSNDEIGILTDSFNTMTKNLKDMIHYLRNSSQTVSQSAMELNYGTESTSQAIEQITRMIQEVASGSKTQLVSIEKGKAILQNLSDIVDAVTSSAEQVTTASNRTSLLAFEGSRDVQRAVEQIDSINIRNTQLASTVALLGERSKDIESIIKVITDIANETNLLALNASIEAARAGEHGKGFAVVADEVKKLSQQSTESSQKIADYIRLILTDIQEAIVFMDLSTKEVTQGKETVHTVGERFEHIKNSVDQVTKQIREVYAVTEEISNSTNLTDAIKQIEEVALLNSNDTQTAFSSTEEQVALMEEIAASSESLSTMAKELEEYSSRFKTN